MFSVVGTAKIQLLICGGDPHLKKSYGYCLSWNGFRQCHHYAPSLMSVVCNFIIEYLCYVSTLPGLFSMVQSFTCSSSHGVTTLARRLHLAAHDCCAAPRDQWEAEAPERPLCDDHHILERLPTFLFDAHFLRGKDTLVSTFNTSICHTIVNNFIRVAYVVAYMVCSLCFLYAIADLNCPAVFCQSTADALVRSGKPCRVLALINDSVGVLTAARYFDQNTGLGVILGTGTNACIVEKVRGEKRSAE